MKQYLYHTLAIFGMILLFFGAIVAIIGITSKAVSIEMFTMLIIGLLEAFAGWKLLRFLTEHEDKLSRNFFRILSRIKPY